MLLTTKIREEWLAGGAEWKRVLVGTQEVLQSGEIGVDFFFVLSGFLIGGSMMKEVCNAHRIAWHNFYMRRLFRIVPAYVGAIVLTILAFPQDDEGDMGYACSHHFWKNLTFLNNFITSNVGGTVCLGQSWSIAVEMQLYLLTPPIFILLAYLKAKWPKMPSVKGGVIAVCVLLCLLSYVLRLLFVFAVSEADFRLLFFTPSILYFHTQYTYSAYAAGVIVGVVVQERDVQVPKTANVGTFADSVMLAMTLAVIVFVITNGGDANWDPLWLNTIHPPDCLWIRFQVALQRPLLDVAAACFTWLSVSGRAPRLAGFLSSKAWKPVAALSYSCYLVQFTAKHLVGEPLYDAFEPGNITAHWARIAMMLITPLVFFIITLPFGLILYTLVERPGILLGKHVISALPIATTAKEGRPGNIEGSCVDESEASTAESQNP